MSKDIDQGASQSDAAVIGHPGIVITVLGDCGNIHPSFEDWRHCRVCDAILKSRRGRITIR